MTEDLDNAPEDKPDVVNPPSDGTPHGPNPPGAEGPPQPGPELQDGDQTPPGAGPEGREAFGADGAPSGMLKKVAPSDDNPENWGKGRASRDADPDGMPDHDKINVGAKTKSDPGGDIKLRLVGEAHPEWSSCVDKLDFLRHSAGRRSHFQRTAQGLAARDRRTPLLMLAMRRWSLPSLYAIAAYWTDAVYEVERLPKDAKATGDAQPSPLHVRDHLLQAIQRGSIQTPAVCVVQAGLRTRNCPWHDLASTESEFDQLSTFCTQHDIRVIAGCIVPLTHSIGAYVQRTSRLIALPWTEQWIDEWREGRSEALLGESLSPTAIAALDNQALWLPHRDGDEKRAANRFFGQLAQFQKNDLDDVEKAMAEPNTLEQERAQQKKSRARFRRLLQLDSDERSKDGSKGGKASGVELEEGRALVPYFLAAHAISSIVPGQPADFGLFRRIVTGILPSGNVPIDQLGPAERKRYEALHTEERQAKRELDLTQLPRWEEYLSRHFDTVFRASGLLRNASGCVVQSSVWGNFSFAEHIFAEAPDLAASTANSFIALLPSLIPTSWAIENDDDRVSWDQLHILDIMAYLRQRMGRQFDDWQFVSGLWRAICHTGEDPDALTGDNQFAELNRPEKGEYAEAALDLLVRAVSACRNADPTLSNARSRPHSEFLTVLLMLFDSRGGYGPSDVMLIRFLTKLTLSQISSFLVDDVRLLLDHVKRRVRKAEAADERLAWPWTIVNIYFRFDVQGGGFRPSAALQWVRWLGAFEQVLFEETDQPDNRALFEFRGNLEYTLNCDIGETNNDGLQQYDDRRYRIASELVFNAAPPGSDYLGIAARRYFPVHPANWLLPGSQRHIVTWRFWDILSIMLDGPKWPRTTDRSRAALNTVEANTFRALACACHLPDLGSPDEAAGLLLARLEQERGRPRRRPSGIVQFYGLFRAALLLHWRLCEFGLDAMRAGSDESGKLADTLTRLLAETDALNLIDIADGLEIIASTFRNTTAPDANARRDGVGEIYEAKADAAGKIANYLRYLASRRSVRANGNAGE